MASPFNMPQWPGVNEPLSFPAPLSKPDPHGNIIDPALILARLREQAAAGKQDVDILMGAIAVAAQAMTDATGAALGMRRDGIVVCVGRSGETAPGLGARLSEDSGISGECLRTCRTQRCDDTEADHRVDTQVCRDLGLRSIAAVPVRSRLETVGILEVFSTEPRAFTDEHLAQLSSLAEIADAACATVLPISQSAGTTPDLGLIVSRPDLPILESPWIRKARGVHPAWRYAGAAGALVLLALFSLAIWNMLHELRSREDSKAVTVQSPPPTAVETKGLLTDQPAVQLKGTPEQIGATGTSRGSAQRDPVVQAARIESEPDDGLIRSIPVSSASTAKSTGSPVPSGTGPTSTPPQVAIVSTPDDSLNGILASERALPKLSPAISEGVTPVVLEHRVMPMYPNDARLLRLEGAVVMHAVVTDQGRVSNLKVVSGNPVLARAALDAVKQWRYRPAELNGRPTRVETDITISFKLP